MPAALNASLFTGFIGIALMLGIAWLMSANRQAIRWRLIVNGLLLQVFVALFCLKVELGRQIFAVLGGAVQTLLGFANEGAGFVFGFLVNKPEKLDALFGVGGSFVFAFKLIPVTIFVATLVSVGYHIGLMQRVVSVMTWAVYKLLGVSGAEALSNAASIFVGQIEAQLMIKPYLESMTRSELMAVMAGSMACIAGGVMAIYIQMGVPAAYLMTASLMALPGAFVIAKLVQPETEHSLTQGQVSLTIPKHSVNIIDAAAMGAMDGMKIGLSVIAMLISFIALIAMVNFVIGQAGLGLAQLGVSLSGIGLDATHLSLNSILGVAFSGIAMALGVPLQDAQSVGAMMGTKLVLNEFVAYADLTAQMKDQLLNPKSVAIASFALCGFANLGSVAMQIGGIGEMAPSKKHVMAQIGIKAMLCGTMASYVSAAWAGILTSIPDSGSSADTLWPVVAMALTALTYLGLNAWWNQQDATKPAAEPSGAIQNPAKAADEPTAGPGKRLVFVSAPRKVLDAELVEPGKIE
ncbi:MAG: NupC/NupG family nucleoside CNT transporter [Candidatus Melainabacteria bacterium]